MGGVDWPSVIVTVVFVFLLLWLALKLSGH